MPSELPPMPDMAGQLREVLDRVGRNRMLSRAGLTRNVLKDLFPNDPLVVSLLVAAMEQGATAALEEQGTSVDAAVLVPRMAQELARSRGLNLDNANWAIGTWALALDTAGSERAGLEQAATTPLEERPQPSSVDPTAVAEPSTEPAATAEAEPRDLIPTAVSPPATPPGAPVFAPVVPQAEPASWLPPEVVPPPDALRRRRAGTGKWWLAGAVVAFRRLQRGVVLRMIRRLQAVPIRW